MNQEDKELLELAANAAGLRVKFEEVHGCYWIELGQGIPIDVWNPLDHDGDALRLAVKLNLWAAVRDGHHHLPPDGDFYVATRRAIVLAAAEIGKRA